MRGFLKIMKRSSFTAVETVELSETNNDKTRWIAVLLLILLGLTGIGIWVNRSLSKRGGWTVIEIQGVSSGCAAELNFRYNLDASKATSDYRELSILYTELTGKADKVFNGLSDINSHPGEPVKVDSALYSALETIESCHSRIMYLAPIYEVYSGIFSSVEDREASDYDPLNNTSLKAQFAEIADYAKDPKSVNLDLLGDNNVCLIISDEYMQYASNNGISQFISFMWLKNAFIIDFIVENLTEKGFTNAIISSYDGYGCNSSLNEDSITTNIYDSSYGLVAQMLYKSPMSYAAFRSYSLSPGENDYYYEYSNGAIRSPYLSAEDGLPANSIDDLFLFSQTSGCASLALSGYSVFVSESFKPSIIDTKDISFIYCLENTIYCNDSAVVFPLTDEKYEIKYTDE